MRSFASLVSRMASLIVSRTSLCCALISCRASESAFRSILTTSHSDRPTLGPPRASGRLSVTTTAIRTSSRFSYFSDNAPSETFSSPLHKGLALSGSLLAAAADRGGTSLPLMRRSTATAFNPKSSRTSYSRRTCSSGRSRSSG